MNWLDYRKKLGIGFHDKKKCEYLFINVFNFLDNYMLELREQIDELEYFVFCSTTGTPMVHRPLYDKGLLQIVTVLKEHTDSLEEFLSYYLAFVNCQQDKDHKIMKKEDFKNLLCDTMVRSQLPYKLLTDKDGYFVFPKGVQEFDDALVSQPLEWLKDYPNAENAWSKALRDYAEATNDNASDVADKFRKALETFFQEFFGGGRSLENYKSDYGKYLKEQDIPKEISGNFETLLQSYTYFMNNYAKHRDGTNDKVLEYIMYQTGNIIRLLITLKQEETANAD